jgi:hypothetical protein
MKLKDQLEASKVYFETIAAVLLSLMAILVSIAQGCTAARQTELFEKQTKIAEAQVLPEFNLHIELQYDQASKLYKNEQLIVDNNGGAAQEWDVDSIEFLRVTYSSSKVALFALNGYYTAGFRSGSDRGRLITLTGKDNNDRFYRLYTESLDSSPCEMALVDLERYVRVSFTDILGSRHVNYYVVAAVSGAKRLQPKEGEAAFKRWRERLTSGSFFLEFNKTTSDLLRSRLRPLYASEKPMQDSRP